MQLSNEWFVANSENEGKPLVVRGRLFLDPVRQSGNFPTRIAIVWDYTGTPDEMPTDKESQVLDILNEQLRNALEENGVAVLTAIFIGNKQARYEYYGTTVEEVAQTVDTAFANYPQLPVRIGAKSDPDWKGYIATIEMFAGNK